MSEENLSCSICNDIYTDPVVLHCSHSFCRDCVHKWWSRKQVQICPLCNQIEHSKKLPSNLALKNLCEDYLLKKEQKPLCHLHSEELKLFCQDHQQLICLVCRDSQEHREHRFIPVNEAAQQYKQQLLQSVKPLREKLVLFEHVKETFDQTAVSLKFQIQKTKKEILQQFDILRTFVDNEEKLRIGALESEEKQKNKAIREKIVGLCGDITTLSDTIRATEEKTRAADVFFLQNYKKASENVQQLHELPVPELFSGALIDQAKHLGNLAYKTWMKMKDTVSFSPVVLDPNTANHNLILSGDLTSVTCGEKHQLLPDNPERFNHSISVLGAEGFRSGFHSWDVEVRKDACWGVGVIKESIERKQRIETGFWELCFFNRKYFVESPNVPRKVISVNHLRKVRVQLDWNRGKLSFFDLDSEKLIYTFKHTFTEKLFPYISTNSRSPLKISPVSVTVAVNHALPLSAGFWGF